MFVDKATIQIIGGNGGNGCISFLRDRHTPNGGPDGGDGGRGGDVVFKAVKDMNTLMDFKFKRQFKAENGHDGTKKNCSGKYGEHLIIPVPVGTIIREKASNKIMADMSTDGEEKVLIRGGRGGRGNQHFATPSMQAPRYAEKGRTAKAYDVVLELKLLADVGIIGFPNVGKSTLLAMATNANPKIANYHFTTLTPNLGVVRGKYGSDFVLADIPGIVEGASEGVGLGFEFLRHVERTKVFIHVIDMSYDSQAPIEAYTKLQNEMELYKENLSKRPSLIAANKMDMPESAERLVEFKQALGDTSLEILEISAATNQGIDALLERAAKLLEKHGDDVIFEEDFEVYVESDADRSAFTIEEKTTRDGKLFDVKGRGIDRMLGYTSLETEKGFAFFQKYLRDQGIIKGLKEAGIQEGDTVKLYELEFEYFE